MCLVCARDGVRTVVHQKGTLKHESIVDFIAKVFVGTFCNCFHSFKTSSNMPFMLFSIKGTNVHCYVQIQLFIFNFRRS